MKVNDLVKIAKQPENCLFPVKGLRGFIEEIIEETQFAQFVELKKDGFGSSGGIPLSCLELCLDQDLIDLKKSRDESINKQIANMANYQKYIDNLERFYNSKILNQTGISQSQLKTIFDILKELDLDKENAYQDYLKK